MSRTYRKVSLSREEVAHKNQLMILLDKIESSDQVFLLKGCSIFIGNINAGIQIRKKNIDDVKSFLISEIKKEERNISFLNADRNHNQGSNFKFAKKQANLKSRKGKRSLKNSIMKNTDLEELENFNDLILFKEPELCAIKSVFRFVDFD